MAEKASSKKRKRPSNGVDTPSKKVAIAGNGDKVKVIHEEAETYPVLLSAPGVNAPGVAFKAYSKAHSSKHTNASRVKPSTHDLLLQSSQHPRLDYTATSNSLDVTQQLSHYVAVYDPILKELRITPAHHLDLRSYLRSEAQEEAEERLTIAKQREALGREFGTKKAKKAIDSKTVNAITQDPKGKGKVTDAQNAILEFVGNSTAGAAAKNDEEEAEALLAAKPIPRPNLAADNVEDVYTFDTLIPPSDARLVPTRDWQDKARAGEEIKFSHRFPAFRVAAAGKSDDRLKLTALRYLALLLEFHDALSNAGRAGKKVPKKDILAKRFSAWPMQLVDAVRRRFADESGQALGKWQQDNLYTHICALSLYIDGWLTDTSNLKDDLKLEQRVISQYFHELGCKVSQPTETEANRYNLKKVERAVTRFARLKLPLDFPKPRAGRKK
ncbi:hypothetical protein DOTSEDRAFT_89151 [Dothistroma septosporum NZE10]|uniref:RNA polymerase I associated factor, A49-like protein n=1 Tax=Dothistroma septosporum (strain NZE10 / CBS 128990) TaxID=675120 RepID=M2Y4K7_DOTSN|nr:hypothetical protein DOTSEDRAFT_89151 [Dothistroma septosporum NZE10]